MRCLLWATPSPDIVATVLKVKRSQKKKLTQLGNRFADSVVPGTGRSIMTKRMFEKSKSVCFTTLATEKLLQENQSFGI
ncbi:hypothetical protein [Nostoc sp.]|uniref:hypothetical protein n=1 Tax=Nostoc sp. TaxID=1180 RepID=UPI002FF95355